MADVLVSRRRSRNVLVSRRKFMGVCDLYDFERLDFYENGFTRDEVHAIFDTLWVKNRPRFDDKMWMTLPPRKIKKTVFERLKRMCNTFKLIIFDESRDVISPIPDEYLEDVFKHKPLRK